MKSWDSFYGNLNLNNTIFIQGPTFNGRIYVDKQAKILEKGVHVQGPIHFLISAKFMKAILSRISLPNWTHKLWLGNSELLKRNPCPQTICPNHSMKKRRWSSASESLGNHGIIFIIILGELLENPWEVFVGSPRGSQRHSASTSSSSSSSPEYHGGTLGGRLWEKCLRNHSQNPWGNNCEIHGESSRDYGVHSSRYAIIIIPIISRILGGPLRNHWDYLGHLWRFL